MSLDMYGAIDADLESRITGGIFLITPASGDYSGPGGKWVETKVATEQELKFVNIQPLSLKKAEILSSQEGGVVNPTDFRTVRINDGTQIYPDDDGKFAQSLRFSDGRTVRTWRVRESDNRPWRNYCKVIVERRRNS